MKFKKHLDCKPKNKPKILLILAMKLYEILHQTQGYFLQNLNQIIQQITYISLVFYTIFPKLYN